MTTKPILKKNLAAHQAAKETAKQEAKQKRLEQQRIEQQRKQKAQEELTARRTVAMTKFLQKVQDFLVQQGVVVDLTTENIWGSPDFFEFDEYSPSITVSWDKGTVYNNSKQEFRLVWDKDQQQVDRSSLYYEDVTHLSDNTW